MFCLINKHTNFYIAIDFIKKLHLAFSVLVQAACQITLYFLPILQWKSNVQPIIMRAEDDKTILFHVTHVGEGIFSKSSS